MKLGQVIGRVVLHTQEPSYQGGRFMIVQPLSREQLAGAPLDTLAKGWGPVAFDELGVSPGDIVGYSESGEAAAAFDQPTPVDAYICAIIDSWNYEPPSVEGMSTDEGSLYR